MGKKNRAVSILLMLTASADLLGMSCCSFNPTPATTINSGTTQLVFAPNGCLVTGDSSGNVNSYTQISGCNYNTTPSDSFSAGTTVNDLDISSNGCLAVATSTQFGVYEPTGSCLSCAFTPTSPISMSSTTTAFAISACLVMGDNAGHVNIYSPTIIGTCAYDLTTPTQTITIPSGAAVSAIAFSASNNCLVIGDINGNVYIYAQEVGCTYASTPVQTLALGAAINDISFSTTGCLSIAANNITIYQPELNCNYSLTTTITAITAPAVTAFSPTGNCLVAGDAAGNINVYNEVSGCTYDTTGIPVIPATGVPVTTIAISLDGCLAVGSASEINIFGPNATLTAAITPLLSTVCSGGDVTLTATATGGTGNYIYTWLDPEGNVIQTGASNILTLSGVTEADTGSYTVNITDGSGCLASAISFVDIVLVTVALAVEPETICSGETATLIANIQGGRTPYTVQFSGFPPIITSNSVVTIPVNPTATTDYTVTVTDSSTPHCSATSNSVTVTVNTIITPVIVSTSTNCSGQITITGTAGAGDTIEVFNGANQIAVPVIAANDGSFSITTMSLPAGTYSSLTLVATNSTNCTSSAPIPSVTVNPILGVSIVGPSIVCAGTSLVLTAVAQGGLMPYVEYVWTGPNFTQSGPSDSITIPNFSLANEGIYTVTVTDSFGCTASANMFVQVESIGTALSVTPGLLCFGIGDATLTGSIVLGTAPYTAEIFANSVLLDTITGITSDTYALTVTPTETTVYTAVVTDSNGCSATSNPVTVMVSRVNVLSITSATANCNGTVTIVGQSDPGNIIAIFNDTLGMQVGGPAIVPQSGIFSITTSAVTNSGMYVFSVVATNQFGCSATAVTNPIQVNAALRVTVAPSSQTICPGSTGTLTATATGGTGAGTYTYQWSGPDGYSATGNPVTITPSNSLNTGTYFVRVTDQNHCTATASASVLVTAVTLSAIGVVCSGTSPVLTVSIADTHPNYTIQIFINGSLFDTQVTSSNTFTYTAPPITTTTTYLVRVTDSVGCLVQSNPVTITASIISSPVITSTMVNCDGTVTINGLSDPGNTITVLLSGVNVSVPVIAGPTGAFSATTEPLAPGTDIVLTVTATNEAGCPASSTTTVSIPDPLELTLSAPLVCIGDTLNITSRVSGGTPQYGYLWMGPDGFSSTDPNVSIPNATLANAGLYTLVVTDSVGCTITDSIFAQVVNVAITLSADPTSVCAGEMSTLTAHVIGGLAPFTVQFSGFPPRSPSTDTVYTQVVSPTLGNNSFTVSVTDSNGCTATSNVVVFDLSPVTPPVITSITVDCLGEVIITGTGTPGNIITVSINGTNISIPVTVDSSGHFTVTTEPLAPGSYTLTVTATNSSGCSESTMTAQAQLFSTQVDVIVPEPLAVILSAPLVCAGNTLTITPTVTGGIGTYAYEWTGPNGFTSTDPIVSIPNATFANAGLYTLVVTDGSCVVESSIFVQVDDVGISLSPDPCQICLGQSSTLRAIITSGLPPYTVTFTGFPPIVTSNNMVSQTVTPSGDTNYTAAVVDANGCSAISNTVNFTFEPLMMPVITSVINNNSGQVTIVGTATPGTLITILLNGIPISIPVIVGPDGKFIVTTMCLARGQYTFEIQATNSACCSVSTLVSTFVDCAPTIITLTNPPCSASCDPRPIITGTTSPNTAIIIYADGVEIGRTASNAVGEFFFVPASPLSNGRHVFTAMTIPGACNCPAGISNSIVIVVDALQRNCLSLTIRNKYCKPCLVI